MSEKQIFVLGAGIVGLACAIDAQRRGHHVTLFDHADPGTGCSFGNAGIIAASEIYPLITPGRLANLPRMLVARDAPAVIGLRGLPRLIPWMLRAATTLSAARQRTIVDGLVALNGAAVGAWRDLLALCGAPDRLREKGMIRLIRDTRDLNELIETGQRLTRHGLPSRLLDKRDLKTLEPALGDAVIGGLLHESDADIGEPFGVSQILLRRFRAAGGTVIGQRAAAIRPLERGAELLIESGKRVADQIIVTAGLASGDLLRPLGAAVPLQAERGYHLALHDVSNRLGRPVTFQRESCVATPMGSTLRLAGTVEFTAADAPADWRRAHRLAIAAQRYFAEPLQQSSPTVWMGSRPSLPDSLPAIGILKDAPAIGYAFGHQHLGITQAAISAKLVGNLMAGEDTPFDPAPYNLTRF